MDAKAHTKCEMNKNSPALSIIHPYFGSEQMPHLLDRLNSICSESNIDGSVERIVVDSSKLENERRACRELCKRFSVQYVEDRKQNQAYSLGLARNIGAQFARGKLLAFRDVDLEIAPDFYARLLTLTETLGIGFFKQFYIPIPCIYLTEYGSEEYRKTADDSRVPWAITKWLEGDEQSIHLLAPCSSFIVVDRLHYLSIGGHDQSFIGHGYEDFELHHRLLSELNLFPRPENYYSDTGSWMNSAYCGFRAMFSLLGRYPLYSNLLSVHLWHERPTSLAFYQAKINNRLALEAAMRRFDQTRRHPAPICSVEHRNSVCLFLGTSDSDSYNTLRDVFPLLGRVEIADEHQILDHNGGFGKLDAVAEFLRKRQVDKILFPNPYRNSARKALLEWCKSSGFPFLVFERGALPDSWFFDKDGFNAGSRSYNDKLWDRELSQQELLGVRNYIKWCVSGIETLEPQHSRVGVTNLRRALRIGREKVLFVPLQRPSDTVTTYFAGLGGSYDQFVDFVDLAAKELAKSGWVVLCKLHPYEIHARPLFHARYVPSDTNFIDLIELSDSIALMNSGSGLYAMMLGKPCYIFSEAFYSFEGMNSQVRNFDSEYFAELVCRGMKVDLERMLRFIHYLREEFYSFGRAKYRSWEQGDGSRRKAATEIDFYEIRLPGMTPIVYSRDQPSRAPRSAPLFSPWVWPAE